MGEDKRGYYAVIPANIRYDKNISANAKLLYGEITALCNEKGYCWASNEYFTKLYSVSRQSITNWLKNLKENGYIEIEFEYKEGSKEILHRYIKIFAGGSKEILQGGSKEILRDNNTIINNTINNTDYEYIVEYLNFKTNSNYKYTTAKTKSLIKARLNEGFTVEDFKKVIDKKTIEWLRNEKMKVYLRPETLFGTKFESYLNQPEKQITLEDITLDDLGGLYE